MKGKDMKYLLLLILPLLVGCTQLAGICPGNEPGQYFVVKNQRFFFFSMNYVIELRTIKQGSQKGKLYYTGKVWPALGPTNELRQDPSTRNGQQQDPQPKPQQPAKAPPKKEPRKEDQPGWWG